MGGKFCQICSFPHPPCYMHSYIAAELFNMYKGILFSKESCFRSCKLTTDVPTVDRASNRSGSTQAMALWNLALYLGISSGFGMLVFLKNLSLIEFQDRHLVLFYLFSVIDGVEWLWMGSLHRNIHLMLEFLKSLFKAQGPTLFLLYINDLPDYTIYNMTVYADYTTLYFNCDQTSHMWHHLEFVSELEFDLQDTVNWGRIKLRFWGSCSSLLN